MKKLFLILTIILLLTSVLWSQSYEVSTTINSGNPGALNEESDSGFSNWITISSDMSPAPANVWSAAQALPFAFEFYGSAVTHYKFSTNGLLSFDTTAATGTPANENTSLPAAGLPDNTIAVFWDAFAADGEAGLIVRTKTFGTAPGRQFWIKYSSLEYSSYDYAYFAVVLEETSNAIYLVDYNRYGGGPGSATLGVQLNSSTAVQHSSSPNYVFLSNDGDDYDNNDYHTFFPIGSTMGVASEPDPEDLESEADIDAQLGWTFAAGTEEYDLYFDTNYPPLTRVVEDGETSGPTGSFDPGTMLNGTTYYWQVVGINSSEEVPGHIWRFTTIQAPKAIPFFDGFETDLSNWFVEGPDVALGSGSVAHTGEGAIVFKSLENSITSSLRVRLAACTNPSVTFWYKIYSNNNNDITVDIQQAGSSEWTTAIWTMPSSAPDQYTKATVDLSAYNTAGGPFWIRLNGTAYCGGIFGPYYNVIIDDFEVTGSPSEIKEVHLPVETELKENYPNPFNPRTVISYQLSVTANVELTVYNALGQKVRTLVNSIQKAGAYSVTFNASGLSSGIYFYKILAGDYYKIRKMVVIK